MNNHTCPHKERKRKHDPTPKAKFILTTVEKGIHLIRERAMLFD